jgi:hypothetical protein
MPLLVSTTRLAIADGSKVSHFLIDMFFSLLLHSLMA